VTPREEKIREVLKGRQSGLIVVLEDIHDPHNAAAILRTCDALGVQHAWFIFDKEERYNPKRVGKSSSSSANKWLSFRTFKSTRECLEALEVDGYTNIATVLHDADTNFDEYAFTQHERIALWVGNEHRGISKEAMEAAVARVKLPMRGMVESLNVSVATALFLYEIIRQRRLVGGWEMDEKDINTLAKELNER